MKKKLIALLAVFTLVLALSACGSSDSSGSAAGSSSGSADDFTEEVQSSIPEGDYSDKTIGFVGMTLNNEYHIILANAVQKAADAAGVNVEIQAGSEHASVDEQLEIIENYIQEGVDGIILVPASSEGLTAAIQEAEDAGIPIINLDTKLSDETLEAVGDDIPFYGTDNYNGGQLTGEFFAEEFPDGAKVAILRGVEGQTNDDDRYNGFLDKAGDVDIVGEQHADWETDKAYTAIQNIIQSNPDLEAVYAENDLMGLGAYQAVSEAGLEDQVKIFSYDGVVAGLQAVVDGQFESTCAQQPIEMGKQGVINMVKVFAGEDPESYIDTGCTLVTSENAESVLETTQKFTEEIKASN